ncbi:MAG: divalent cation tolerance protein CutA [Candidatus Altiarchaeota archaeon]|nr:divalent cation tolerance protein CutA [Candidatus Altiarchaeota archaeon]
MTYLIGYITYPDLETAERILDRLFELKLIACANILPVKSVYRWRGKIEKSDEVVSLVKTKGKNGMT